MSEKEKQNATEVDNEEVKSTENVENNVEEKNDAENKKELTVEEKLAKAQEEIVNLEQKVLYLQADYQNYRKRMVKDIADARVNSVGNTLVPFLNVYDFLGMAETAAEKSDNIDSIRQGLKMIIGEFNKAFEEIGVKKFSTNDCDFDPLIHEAVSHEANEEIAEGKIIKEWSGGFKLGEKLLRPARVVVSAGKDKKE